MHWVPTTSQAHSLHWDTRHGCFLAEWEGRQIHNQTHICKVPSMLVAAKETCPVLRECRRRRFKIVKEVVREGFPLKDPELASKDWIGVNKIKEEQEHAKQKWRHVCKPGQGWKMVWERITSAGVQRVSAVWCVLRQKYAGAGLFWPIAQSLSPVWLWR